VFRQKDSEVLTRGRDDISAFTYMKVVVGAPAQAPHLFAPWVVSSADSAEAVAGAIKSLAGRVVDCMRVAKCLPILAVKWGSTDAVQARVLALLWNQDCAMLANPFCRKVKFINQTGDDGLPSKINEQGVVWSNSPTDTFTSVIVSSEPNNVRMLRTKGAHVRLFTGNTFKQGIDAMTTRLGLVTRWRATDMESAVTKSAAEQLLAALQRYPGGGQELAKRI